MHDDGSNRLETESRSFRSRKKRGRSQTPPRVRFLAASIGDDDDPRNRSVDRDPLAARVFIGHEPRLTHVEADFSVSRRGRILKGGRSRGVERSREQFRVSSRHEDPARCRMPTKLRHSRAAISNRVPIRTVNQTRAIR